MLLLRSRADNHQPRQHSDGAAAQHEPFGASVFVVSPSRDHGRRVSVHHGHFDHGQHAAHHAAHVPSHHRASWAKPPQHAVSAYDPYGQHREHTHSRIVASESASARHPSGPYTPHCVPHMVDHGSHSSYGPRFSSAVGYPTQQTHHAQVLQSPSEYALDSEGGIAKDIPDMRFPSPMKSRPLMYTDPSMASRGRLHYSHEVVAIRPICNSLGWELWVLKLTAKERNQVIKEYNLTDAEATHLKKAARRTKQRETQRRYLLRKRKRSIASKDSQQANETHSTGTESDAGAAAAAGRDSDLGDRDATVPDSDTEAIPAKDSRVGIASYSGEFNGSSAAHAVMA